MAEREAVTITLPDGDRLQFRPSRLVVAGYTGRDRKAVEAHIQELAEQGIAPPERVPTYFELPPDLAVASEQCVVEGSETSGEVEPVLLFTAAGPVVTIGSDHTDRLLEREDVGRSKAACPKPFATDTLDYQDVLRRWDECVLQSSVDAQPYQQGDLALVTPADQLVEDLERELGPVSEGLVLFLGTIPLTGGAFVFGEQFEMSLAHPSGREVQLRYRVLRRT